MRRPSIEQLAAPWDRIARTIAVELAARGHRGWIVGGAVRDLALGIPPLDVDMASAARPEEIEALFEHTTAVGRAFGTLVVHLEGRDVQLTTFRSEAGYSDARRPDEVRYGASVEEDAARRDFTCNALYLDPLDDTLLDPCGGLADLEQRRLRCVGDPALRFREDGLRLVRMARLAAALGLEVDPETLEAARESADALSGVSPERLLAELQRIFEKRGAARALRLLWETGLLARVLPRQPSLHPPGPPSLGSPSPGPPGPPGPSGSGDAEAETLRLRALEALEALGGPVGLDAGASVLFDPSPFDPLAQPGDFDAAREGLERLRPTRATRRAVVELWRLERDIEALFRLAIAPRSTRVRIVRDPHWREAARLVRAWRAARGSDVELLEELEAFAASLPEDARHPQPLIAPGDLAQRAVPRGPRWSALLEAAETLQLDGRLVSREQALAWLDERLHDEAAAHRHEAHRHEGGNTSRKTNDKG